MTPTPETSAAPLVARLRELLECAANELALDADENEPTRRLVGARELVEEACAALETAQQGEGDRQGNFPLIVDQEREYIAGSVIRKAVEMDPSTMRFYLTCSVGEVAQRVVVALAARRAAPTPERDHA